MKKKRISPQILQKILNTMPLESKQKLAEAIRKGKQIHINIKTKKMKKGIPSPYHIKK